MSRSLFLLLPAGLLCLTPLSYGDDVTQRESTDSEAQRGETEQAEQIGECLENTLEAWFNQAEQTRCSYEQQIERMIAPLNLKDLSLLARHQTFVAGNHQIFYHWASKDPEAALKAVWKIEQDHLEVIKNAAHELEGGPGDTTCQYIHEMYAGVFRAWAKKAPKQAWSAFQEKDGIVAKSLVMEDYGYVSLSAIFQQLARVDANFAFQKINQQSSRDWGYIGMVSGYLHGAPKGRDWQREASIILGKNPSHWTHGLIRTQLLGRWLEDDAKAAQAWFQKGETEGIHFVIRRPEGEDPFAPDDSKHPGIKERLDLALAAGYWAARDFTSAWRWLKSYPASSRKDFATDFFRGAESYLGFEYGQAGTRDYFLSQLTRIPGQADRDLFARQFATQLWVFDSTQMLGQPAPNKDKWLQKVRQSLDSLKLSPSAQRDIISTLRKTKPAGFWE